MTTNGTQEEIMIPSILAREIRPIVNWEEWLTIWDKASTFDEMLGLLHVGFNVTAPYCNFWDSPSNPAPNRNDQIGRIVFYFSLADGWNDSTLLELPSDGRTEYEHGRDKRGNTVSVSPSEVRRLLAEKAFSLLCTNFFKSDNFPDSDDMSGRSRTDFMRAWEAFIFNDRLFPVILKFFRPQKNRWNDSIIIRNLNHRDEQLPCEKQLHSFLQNFTIFLWNWEEREVDSYDSDKTKKEKENHNAALGARVKEAMVWMIEVLYLLKRLDVLEKWTLRLNQECLIKLEEIALRSELSRHAGVVKEDRQVRTLEESCYAGSRAGWFLMRYRVMTSEYARLREIRETEIKVEQASRQLAELTAKK